MKRQSQEKDSFVIQLGFTFFSFVSVWVVILQVLLGRTRNCWNFILPLSLELSTFYIHSFITQTDVVIELNA